MKRIVNATQGQAMVEMALVLPLLLIIVIGIAEFGMMFSNYLTLNNVTRETARYASLGGSDIESEARGYSVSGVLDRNELVIVITPAEANRTRGDSVEVVGYYNHKLLIPFLNAILGEGIPLEAKTVMRVE